MKIENWYLKIPVLRTEVLSLSTDLDQVSLTPYGASTSCQIIPSSTGSL